MAATGVAVASICADYFVDYKILRASAPDRRRHLQVLTMLIERAAQLNASVIVLPFLGAGEPRDDVDDAALLESLKDPIVLAHASGITLAVESNVPAGRYRSLIEQAHSPGLSICFDTGNRAAAGLDILEDILLLRPYVREVHIKDRLPNGPNVPLGQGAAPLRAFLDVVRRGADMAPLILETTVGDDYEYHAKRNLSIARSYQM
jgi:sugar phosphate isomerase/epimerase